WTKIDGGTKDLKMQKDYFNVMFEKCAEYDWHRGHSIWSWSITQSSAGDDKGYAVLDKPAQDVVKGYYSTK
ncbi:MAG: hypothetical protein Q8930_15135, partial [Bacillota bacterium]|nr:hypothetical protein [Bacillota bacterium]